MCKLNKNGKWRIDPCIKHLVENINWMLDTNLGDQEDGWRLVASCCGHGKYPMTLVAQDEKKMTLELCSDKYIGRRKKFYKKDKQGYYYIPETLAVNKKEDDGLPPTDESVGIRPTIL